jgi:CheY-like chemotaxis protein
MAQFAPLNPATILVVENEAMIRIELVDWLSDLGLVVLAANNADEAITLLDGHPEIELMMTDIRMPGSMDGARLAHHVRGRWPAVKIIVASGWADAQLRDLPKGSIFVPKPFELASLWKTLSRVAGARRAVRSSWTPAPAA